MNFRRRSSQQTGRQKLRSDDLGASPSTFAYRARRSEGARNPGRQMQYEAAPAVRDHLISFWLQRFGLLILLLAVMASLINILSLSGNAKTVLLSNQANQPFLQPAMAYQRAADQQLAGSIWNRNKITIDTNAISQHLLGQFPELSGVSVTVPLLAHRPAVYFEPAQPALVLVAGNGSFVLDTRGKALLAANATSATQSHLPTVDDQNRLNVQLNHQALSADNVTFIQTVVGQLAAKQLTVATMALPAGTSELDVHLNGQPYFVKFNLESSDARGEAGTFLATLTQLKRQNIIPSQYIDVRVDGRAYYK